MILYEIVRPALAISDLSKADIRKSVAQRYPTIGGNLNPGGKPKHFPSRSMEVGISPQRQIAICDQTEKAKGAKTWNDVSS